MKRNLRKTLCLLLSGILLVGTMSAAAEESRLHDVQTVAQQLSTIPSELSKATFLSDQQVKRLVEYQTNTYLQSEMGEASANVVPAERANWISLYDFQENCFAYMVPLVDMTAGEIGHITVSAIKDGFTNYEMSLSTSRLNAARIYLAEYENAKVVFLPPMEYAIQEGIGGEKTNLQHEPARG